MAALKGSKTEQNLKDAFAGESQANRRYLYFAQKADVEGFNDVAAVFRSTAEGETGHAHGHLEFLEEVGDPATGKPIGATVDNLKAAIAGETHEYTDMYPGMAKTARQEGFDEIADWFETLAKAEKSHAGRFQKALDTPRLSNRLDVAGASSGAPPISVFVHRDVRLHAGRQSRGADAPSDRLAGSGFLRPGQDRGGDAARLRHLPRLPALLQSVRQLSAAVRPDRRQRRPASSTASRQAITARSSKPARSATCAS